MHTGCSSATAIRRPQSILMETAAAMTFIIPISGNFVKCMEFWESRYREKDFVCFTVVHQSTGKIAGMAEICPSYKYSADGACMGILRLDLLPEHETRADIQELLEAVLAHVYEDFQIRSVLMQAPEDARIRREVVKGLHFVPAQDECSIPFQDYFIRY